MREKVNDRHLIMLQVLVHRSIFFAPISCSFIHRFNQDGTYPAVDVSESPAVNVLNASCTNLYEVTVMNTFFHTKQYAALVFIIMKAYTVSLLGMLSCCSAQWCGKIAVSQHSCMTTIDEQILYQDVSLCQKRTTNNTSLSTSPKGHFFLHKTFSRI